MLVKICGLNPSRDVQICLDLNVNFLGFVFYDKSPRNLKISELNILNNYNKKNSFFVAVTVNPSDEFIDKIFEDYVTVITKAKFIRAISNDKSYMNDIDLNPFDGIKAPSGRKSECTWLFQPSKIREIFKRYIKNSI